MENFEFEEKVSEVNTKPVSHASWMEGGTHITNFPDKQFYHYKKAVEAFNIKEGKTVLLIDPAAYDSTNCFYEGSKSLHLVAEHSGDDLSRFWRLFDSIGEHLKSLPTHK